ncbi:hypothetical protein EBU71_11460 [bacterium]|nr:hypothetical protein [Candidatus Elulimicrobium humile]
MNIREIKAYNNKKPIEFVIRENFRLKEDQAYIPRFKLKDIYQIADVPVNEPMKVSEAMIIKAIKYGMVFLINYKGAMDDHFAGHERVFQPMVLGRSSKGKLLIRGFHLNGWSVSQNKKIDKIWRMFRLDRILSITFLGSFYRLPPSGYNMNDRGMRGGIIARADFNEIRKNQQTLIKQQQIQNKEDITLEDEGRKFVSIRAKTTETMLDMNKPFENAYINNLKDTKNVRVSFLKSIYGNKWVALLGAIGDTGNTVKITDDKGVNLGVFKVLDSISGDTLKKIKRVKGNFLFELYLFDKKI